MIHSSSDVAFFLVALTVLFLPTPCDALYSPYANRAIFKMRTMGVMRCSSLGDVSGGNFNATESVLHDLEILETRIRNLEALTSSQQTSISKLRRENDELYATIKQFNDLIEALKEAGLGSDSGDDDDGELIDTEYLPLSDDSDGDSSPMLLEYEYFDDAEIFGAAPSSVIEAADSAGAAILAAMLAGQRRMLVDVRDAELTNNAEVLAQFVELSILPVAAGLEGLNAERNRVKIVFPTVSKLLEYRKLSALAAPEVVALGTLGFGSLEDPDALVVILAPSSEESEEFKKMVEILNPSDPSLQIEQPIVVLNHHMNGIAGLPEPIRSWETVYHLRLLSVQYLAMEEDAAADPGSKAGDDNSTSERGGGEGQTEEEECISFDKNDEADDEGCDEVAPPTFDEGGMLDPPSDPVDDAIMDDAAFLSAAAEQEKMNSSGTPGHTRAMVIRAYPRPWHVFVDISADEDADFEIAQTFIDQPTQEEVNTAIVECLEGSEMQDELVAREMKAAFESGQLENVSRRLAHDASDVEEDEDEDVDWPVPLGVEYEGSANHTSRELFKSKECEDECEDEEDEEEAVGEEEPEDNDGID